MMVHTLLLMALGTMPQISPNAQYEEFKAVKQPFLKVAALQGFKVRTVNRSVAWFHPGYYALKFVYEIDRSKLDTIRKQLPGERFIAAQTNGPAPTMFWRDEPSLKQIVDVPIPSTGYSDLSNTNPVSLYEHPVGSMGIKMWPKPLLDPKPPLGKKHLYPYPFLQDLTLLSIETETRPETTYATVFYTSPLSPKKLAEKMEPLLRKDWHSFMGRNTIRFSPRKRFNKTGPYQIDLQRLVNSGTRVMVASQGVDIPPKR